MPLTLQLHPDLEAAAHAAGDALWRDADPLASVAVVVEGHRQARWLRHQLAHAHRISAGLRTLTLDQALDAAAAYAAGVPAHDAARPWWEHPAPEAWTEDVLATRILEAWRTLGDRPELGGLRAYLGPLDAGPVPWRALGLAREVAACLLDLSRARPAQVVAWARGDADAPPIAPWLRATCAALALHTDGPAAWRHALRDGPTTPPPPSPLVLIGLATVRNADRETIARLARTWGVRWHRPTVAPERWTQPSPPSLDPFASSFQAAEEAERAAWSRASWGGGGHPLRNASPDLSNVAPVLRFWHAALRGAPDQPPAVAAPLAQLHACWDAQREVEALRDVLLDAFAAGGLEPRDVLVLTPDLETYAPLVQAVFARTGTGAHPVHGDVRVPAIPLSVGNLGLSRTNPLAEVLLQVLELCTDRLTAAGVVALLSRGPVQRAFALSTEDVADLADTLRDSGARWGLDAADRVAVYGRDDDRLDYAPNTLAFGMERHALGVVFPSAGDDPVPSDDPARPPRAAMASGSRERLHTTGALVALLRELEALRSALATPIPRTARAWRELLSDTLPRFARTGDTTAWLAQDVRSALADALPDDSTVPLSPDAVRRLLARRFDLPARGATENASAVVLAPLGPASTTPHAFVALLGMNTGAWPRQGRHAAWDPRAVPIDGEHALDVRDRHVLLEALLCARRDVFVSWTAHEPRKGAEVPPCVPVAQLVDALAPGVPVDRLATRHARHPWSAGHGGRGYDADFRACAGGETPPAYTDGDVLPPEAHPPVRLPLDTLARDLRAASQLLLQGRLGVYLAESEAPIAEREPLALDTLTGWSLRSAMLDELRDAPDADPEEVLARHLRRLSGRGELPLAAGAEETVRSALAEVMAELRSYRALHDHGTVRHARAALALRRGELTLSGVVPEICERNGRRVHHWLTASKADSETAVVRAWVHLLTAWADGERNVAARIVGKPYKGTATLKWLDLGRLTDAETPEAVLNTLLDAWWLARRRAVPLFESTGMALAGAYLGAKGDERAILCEGAVRAAWFGGPFQPAESADRWVRALHAGWDPTRALHDLDVLGSPSLPALDETASFCTLTRAVWVPLLRCMRSEGTKMRDVRHLWPV